MSSPGEWLRLSEVLRILKARGYSSDDATTAIAAALAWGGPLKRLRFPECPSLWPRSGRRNWTDENGALVLDFDKSTILVPLKTGRRIPVWSAEIVEISREDVDRVWPDTSANDMHKSDDYLVVEGIALIKTGKAKNPAKAAQMIGDRAIGNSRASTEKRLERKIRAQARADGIYPRLKQPPTLS